MKLIAIVSVILGFTALRARAMSCDEGMVDVPLTQSTVQEDHSLALTQPSENQVIPPASRVHPNPKTKTE
jgi:hypothetical protein